MEFSFDFPPPIRKLQDKLRLGDIWVGGGRVPTEKLAEKLSLMDKLHNKAAMELASFIFDQHPQEAVPLKGLKLGWTKAREYKRPESVFDLSKDPFAPGSIVVDRWYYRDPATGQEEKYEDLPEPCYFWISEKRDENGVPYVFSLNRVEDAVRELLGGEKIDLNKWKNRHIHTVSLSHPASDGWTPENLFACRTPPDIIEETGEWWSYNRRELELWTRGKGTRERGLKKLTERRPVPSIVKPLPIPI